MNASTRLLAIYGLMALVALIYWPSTIAIGRLWTDYNNLGHTHGPLVAAISLWLIFRERGQLAAVEVWHSRAALVFLGGCTIAWMLFYRADILGLHLALIPLLMWLATYAVFGRPVARLMAFPLGLFYFALTVLDRLSPLLQSMTIHAVSLALSFMGVPVQIDGTRVAIPEGAFHIEGGCSGQHYFVVGLALALLSGEIGRDSPRQRLRLLVIMAGLALLTNWVRVLVVIMAGHLTRMTHPLVHEHYYFGWALFAAAFALFLLLTRGSSSRNKGLIVHQRPPEAGSSVSVAVYITAVLVLLTGPVLLYSFEPTRRAVDRIAMSIADNLRGSVLPSSSPRPVDPPPTMLADSQQLFLLGLESLRDGAYARAESKFLQAREVARDLLPAPQEAILTAALVESQLALGKIAEAEATCRQLALLAPDTSGSKLLAARVTLAKGGVLDGIGQLQRLTVEQPDYVPARLLLGSVLLRRGRILLAQNQFSEALRVAPDNPQARALMGQARLLQLEPENVNNPLLLNNLAWVYYLQGDPRATETARRAHELAPTAPAITDTYGWILHKNGKTALALPLLEHAAREATDNAAIQYHYAAMLSVSGQFEQAQSVLSRALRLKQDPLQRRELEALLIKLRS